MTQGTLTSVSPFTEGDLRNTGLVTVQYLTYSSSQALHEKASCSGCSGSDPPGMSWALEAEAGQTSLQTALTES